MANSESVSQSDSLVEVEDLPLVQRPKKAIANFVREEVRGHTLELWQQDLCDWLAARTLNKEGAMDAKDIRVIASALAERQVTYNEIQALRATPAWRKRWERKRHTVLTSDLADAKEKAIGLVGKGMVIYDQMLDKVQREDDAKTFAKLGVPLLERALPKKTEATTIATSISVTLTPEQFSGLDGPVLVVEAEEVQQLPATT